MHDNNQLIIVGGGEFSRVVADTAQRLGFSILGCVTPQPSGETARFAIPRLGDDNALAQYPEANLVLGVGAVSVNDTRCNIVKRIGVQASRWVRLIDPAAYVSATAQLAEGTIVLPGAVIEAGARIGRHCIVNLGAKIDHDVVVGEFVHIAPQAALGGGATVGDHAYIGMGALVRDHTKVDDRTLVGMGAVVTKSYPAGSTLVGLPAKPLVQDNKIEPAA